MKKALPPSLSDNYLELFLNFIAKSSTKFANVDPRQLGDEIDVVMETIGHLVGSDRCVLGRSTKNKGFLLTHVWSSSKKLELLGKVYGQDNAKEAVDILYRDHALIILDRENIRDSMPGYYTLMKSDGLEAEIVLPLMHDTEIIGAISIAWNQAVKVLPDEVFKLLQIIGEMIFLTEDRAEREREKKALEEAILNVRKEEQKRIGRDLHDDLGQQLTGIAFLIKLLANQLEKKLIPKSEEAKEILLKVNKAIDTTRRISKGLYAIELEAIGFISSVGNLVAQTHETSRVECSFKDMSQNFDPKLDICEHLYRIIQEALNNAIKHAKAKYIHVVLATDKGETTVSITDDGIGFTKNSDSNLGMGLQTMLLRSKLIGANLEIQSKLGNGTVINLKLCGTQQD